MLTRGMAVVVVGILGAGVLLYVARDVSWSCGFTTYKKGIGHPVVSGRTTSYGPVSGSTSTHGAFLISHRMRVLNDSDPQIGTIESVNINGLGDLTFKYEGDITKIYVWSGRSLIYKGAPVQSLHAPDPDIGLFFEWDGPEATVQVSDRCSLSSFGRESS
jgi:hypothetical protein